jgi:uncharacterized membrane-anchored protein YhcB (DUF1043 family)
MRSFFLGVLFGVIGILLAATLTAAMQKKQKIDPVQTIERVEVKIDQLRDQLSDHNEQTMKACAAR